MLMNPILFVGDSMLVDWFLSGSVRMLFSNIMAKTSDQFAERHTAREVSEGAVFIYGENFDVYVSWCLVFIDDAMTDHCEPAVAVRTFPWPTQMCRESVRFDLMCCFRECSSSKLQDGRITK